MTIALPVEQLHAFAPESARRARLICAQGPVTHLTHPSRSPLETPKVAPCTDDHRGTGSVNIRRHQSTGSLTTAHRRVIKRGGPGPRGAGRAGNPPADITPNNAWAAP